MTRRAASRPSFIWLQVLLVAALACVVLILVEAFRAARSSQVVAERALRDYASFAAWSYREHLTVTFRDAVDELLAPVNHGEGLHSEPGWPDASRLGHYIQWNPACLCHRPRKGPTPQRYFGFTLGSDSIRSSKNLSPTPEEGWLGDAPLDGVREVPVHILPADEARWLNRTLTEVARRTPRSGWGYDVTIARRDSVLHFLASRSMPMINGDTVVYAVEYSARDVHSILGAVLTAQDLLPPSLVERRGNHEVLDLEVTDASGTRLYATSDTPSWELDTRTALPASYGGLQIRTQMRPAMAGVLLIGGVPGSRVPLLLTVLALTTVLCVLAALQLRREARFATERSNFVANVSHELRTPLTQVRLVLDTLRLGRGGDAAARDSALGIADREVLRLQHLVEGVLRFARGPRRNDAPRVPIDAYAEAEAVAREFQPLASPRGIRVVVTGDPGATVALQNGALRQTLLNLLDNAVKYGRDGAAVEVDVRRQPQGGVRVAVTDSGPGVPAADRARIWRPFERGEAARQRAAGGSGIGLTIVAEIAAEHGGRAWVEDGAGGGARFVVELPDRAEARA